MASPFSVYLPLRVGYRDTRYYDAEAIARLFAWDLRIERARATLGNARVCHGQYSSAIHNCVELAHGKDSLIVSVAKSGDAFSEEASRFVIQLLTVPPGEKPLLCTIHASRPDETFDLLGVLADAPQAWQEQLLLCMSSATASSLATLARQNPKFLTLAHAVIRVEFFVNRGVQGALGLPVGSTDRCLHFWASVRMSVGDSSAVVRLLLQKPGVKVQNHGNDYVTVVMGVVQSIKGSLAALESFLGVFEACNTPHKRFVMADGDFAISHNIREFLVGELF